jgi:hypothetical protein
MGFWLCVAWPATRSFRIQILLNKEEPPVRLGIPKPKLPFKPKTKPQEVIVITQTEDPLEREWMEFSKKLLAETHETNMRILRQSLEDIRQGHHKKES